MDGTGESLSTFCSREDCCNGSGSYQCASFWSTSVSYSLCTGSCKGDRACQGIALNASGGSVSIGAGSCSDSSSSAGNACKNLVNDNTGTVNVSIGAGSCLDNGCGNIGDSASAGTYTVSVGDNSCTSGRSCSYAGGNNGSGDFSISIGDNSCQSSYACWGLVYATSTTTGIVVPDNECNGADNICKFCGSGSDFTDVFQATSSCCSADGDTESTSTSVDYACYGPGFICLQTNLLPWQSSQDAATANGANLVSIRCPEQNQRLTELNSSDQVWVGASDSASEGDWVFLDGGSATYTNWATGQPNNYGDAHCMEFNYLSTGFWNDSESNLSLGCSYHWTDLYGL